MFRNEQIEAAAIFFMSGRNIIFIFAASSQSGRKTGAMRYLLDWLIRRYSGSNLVLDFEGSSVPSVEYFYKSFGAELRPFVQVIYVKNRFWAGLSAWGRWFLGCALL
ncbi:MAG: hypothetical protein WCR52_19340 [Bacteroidota bacterium]